MAKNFRKVIKDLGNEVKVKHKNNFEIRINKNGLNIGKGDWIEYYYTENEEKLDFNSLKIVSMASNIAKIYGSHLDYSTKNPDLFDNISREVVKLFEFAGLTINKLRQYYQSIVNLYNVYKKKEEKEGKFDISELETEFNILLAKINYDMNRKSSKVPKEVYDFVKYHKDKVFENKDGEKVFGNKDGEKVKEKFKIFRKHFETVVAYAVGKLR